MSLMGKIKTWHPNQFWNLKHLQNLKSYLYFLKGFFIARGLIFSNLLYYRVPAPFALQQTTPKLCGLKQQPFFLYLRYVDIRNLDRAHRQSSSATHGSSASSIKWGWSVLWSEELKTASFTCLMLWGRWPEGGAQPGLSTGMPRCGLSSTTVSGSQTGFPQSKCPRFPSGSCFWLSLKVTQQRMSPPLYQLQASPEASPDLKGGELASTFS